MTKEQRTARARIISNMIKADNIIEGWEIRDMKMLMSECVIIYQEMSDARLIRFTNAVNACIKGIPNERAKSFFRPNIDLLLCLEKTKAYNETIIN